MIYWVLTAPSKPPAVFLKLLRPNKDGKGYVQTVELYLDCSDPDKSINHVLVYPIDKIVLLVDSYEEVLSLTEEIS